MSAIASYALLSDCRSAALVGADGAVDWWCAPRFDAASTFGRLLDPDAGHFTVRPAGRFDVDRRYRPGTLVLEADYRCAGGRVRVADALAFAPGARGHEIGLAPGGALVRVAECLAGEVELEVELAPRPEYGLAAPALVREDGWMATLGGPARVFLAGGEGLALDGAVARGRLRLRAGERHAFALHHRPGVRAAPPARLDAAEAVDDTTAAWRSWSELHGGYAGAYAAKANFGALVLQALTYAPSGAVVAAATTSLPERHAGDANWDYRYAWLRDASFVLNAFWVAACPDEADRYFQWMARAAGTATGEGTQVVFGVEGERRLDEAELGHLAGFGGARPVRVGNDAWRQTQLDVYGAVLDAAWALRERLDADPLVHRFLCGLADGAAARWGDRDAGIWEDRDCERHNVSSKTMCWLALDRAVRLAERLGAGGGQVVGWTRERDRVRDAVLRRGWSDERGAYVGAFDSPRLDASVLLMPMVGLVDARDERMLATVRAIERGLGTERGLLRRLEDVDEGAFLACSFWLAQCHALAGDTDRAREVFEAAAATAGDVGLLAEQADPADGALLGNVPQALSHASLVNAAWCIDEVERGRR